jgi:hypothetical protein
MLTASIFLLFFAEHRLDIVQILAICRFSPFNGRGITILDRKNGKSQSTQRKKGLSLPVSVTIASLSR